MHPRSRLVKCVLNYQTILGNKGSISKEILGLHRRGSGTLKCRCHQASWYRSICYQKKITKANISSVIHTLTTTDVILRYFVSSFFWKVAEDKACELK